VSEPRPWWQEGVLYQIYPRSFADSNRDGVGDLAGVTARLDHLAWLGVNGVWLCPVTASPNADWGYDVSDYRSVDPELGTSADLDELIAEAGRRGIRVLLDLVPNHTSDRHPWFLDARSSRSAAHRDWYVWADPRADGSPPNNWVSSFGGPGWTFDDRTGQYYLSSFLPEQPDLNWWNESVRAEFESILHYWFDRGVAGFRIDVCHKIVKDALLRDNPPASEEDHWMVQLFGQRSVHNSNQPEVHEVLRSWRRLCSSYDPPRILIGETNVEELDTMISYYGRGDDELNLAFNFPFINAPFEAEALRSVVEQTEALLPDGAWPVWTASNHDVSRFPSRWAHGDPRKARVAMLLLLGLRGTPLLYQGDEIGLTDTELDRGDLLDPVGMRFWPYYRGRDPVRTPMPWRDAPGAGFTSPGTKTWLLLGDTTACNVESQLDDPDSMLALTRDLIGLRQREASLRAGKYSTVPAPAEVWSWYRGDDVMVALNLAEEVAEVGRVRGTVLICTERARDGEKLRGSLRLDPWEGVVVSLG
jgi:alpha-glucosidase